MDATLYAKILSDKNITNLKKLKYKYPEADLKEFIALLKTSVYKSITIMDFAGSYLVYMDNITQIRMNTVKLLLTPQSSNQIFGIKAMEDEIASTFNIENIDFSRESVRKILSGYAPSDESEHRIYAMMKGLEFISDQSNKISEANILQLYNIAISQYLPDDAKLQPGSYYRHDCVYIVAQDLEHTGLPCEKLPVYMKEFVNFINTENMTNDLLKAAVIHFYLAYLHPYFDGNGRISRLMHLWYLRQQGYSSALFIPFSSFIESSRKKYYDTFTLAENNEKISGVLDVTPFLVYFIENVYNKLEYSLPQNDITQSFQKSLSDGIITEKEKDLWNFVLSAYGNNEFSTKQLERDFRNAAYATIRAFVLKFAKIGLLSTQVYKNRVKYKIK